MAGVRARAAAAAASASRAKKALSTRKGQARAPACSLSGAGAKEAQARRRRTGSTASQRRRMTQRVAAGGPVVAERYEDPLLDRRQRRHIVRLGFDCPARGEVGRGHGTAYRGLEPVGEDEHNLGERGQGVKDRSDAARVFPEQVERLESRHCAARALARL
jgi:hypothetical protein